MKILILFASDLSRTSIESIRDIKHSEADILLLHHFQYPTFLVILPFALGLWFWAPSGSPYGTCLFDVVEPDAP